MLRTIYENPNVIISCKAKDFSASVHEIGMNFHAIEVIVSIVAAVVPSAFIEREKVIGFKTRFYQRNK